MLAHEAKMHRSHAGHQEISRSCTRGESNEFIDHASEAFKPRADVTTSSKQRYQLLQEKGLMSAKNY